PRKRNHHYAQLLDVLPRRPAQTQTDGDPVGLHAQIRAAQRQIIERQTGSNALSALKTGRRTPRGSLLRHAVAGHRPTSCPPATRHLWPQDICRPRDTHRRHDTSCPHDICDPKTSVTPRHLGPHDRPAASKQTGYSQALLGALTRKRRMSKYAASPAITMWMSHTPTPNGNFPPLIQARD